MEETKAETVEEKTETIEPVEDVSETVTQSEKMPESPNNGTEVEEAPQIEEKSTDEIIAETKDPVLLTIEELSSRVEQLCKQFEAKIMHTTHEEKIVDQMHAELQRYKEDMYSQLVRPVLLDIIEVRDIILRMSQTYRAKAPEEQVVPLKIFSDYSYDMQDILEKNNIVIYQSKEGEAFTPIRQRVVKKVKTAAKELHGKIAESLSDGYEYMGKPISPEKIAVYVYDETENKEGDL